MVAAAGRKEIRQSRAPPPSRFQPQVTGIPVGEYLDRRRWNDFLRFVNLYTIAMGWPPLSNPGLRPGVGCTINICSRKVAVDGNLTFPWAPASARA